MRITQYTPALSNFKPTKAVGNSQAGNFITPDFNSNASDCFIKSEEQKDVSFGHKNKLKTLWKEGLLPSVKKGLYGNILTEENITLEHLTPVSQGGKTRLGNLALAVSTANHARGTTPLSEVLSAEQFNEYLEQFKDVKVKGFNGNDYIRCLKKKAAEVWNIIPKS